MASSSLTVHCDRGVIRVYGGNRSDVRTLHHYYSNLTLENFLRKHLHLNENDYNSMKLYKKFNKN